MWDVSWPRSAGVPRGRDQHGQYYEHCKSFKAKRLEGEAVMSALSFFQSAGRGDPKFWGEDDRPTVVAWKSSSESEQEQWSKKMGKSKDWVVWFRSRKLERRRATPI